MTDAVNVSVGIAVIVLTTWFSVKLTYRLIRWIVALFRNRDPKRRSMTSRAFELFRRLSLLNVAVLYVLEYRDWRPDEPYLGYVDDLIVVTLALKLASPSKKKPTAKKPPAKDVNPPPAPVQCVEIIAVREQTAVMTAEIIV